MPIPVQNIIDKSKQVGLDAEGTDYYRFDLDFQQSINEAVQWLMAVINAAYGDGKIGEEIFQEITYARIFQTNQYSRIGFDTTELGHDLWTILGVYPKPTLIPSAAVIVAQPLPEDSKYRNDVTFNKTTASGAKRLTIEEWGSNLNNPFAAGNAIVTCDDLVSYAYLNYIKYGSSGYVPGVPEEIELRPELSEKFVGVFYVARPAPITLETDIIPFPFSLESLLFNKTQNLVSRKQGDGTTIFSVTEKDINLLIDAIQ